MAVDVAGFRARYPEFADAAQYPDALIQRHIDDALCILGNGSNWCSVCIYEQAVYAYVAHLLTLAERTAAGDANAIPGTISSKTAGGVSVSYATPSGVGNSNPSDMWLDGTLYGQFFKQLRNQCLIGVMVATF